ncbi:anoctamin-4-like [Battus philenor]|uniref:anoctamin-4-like n=1 Tax=Battus philenor TaxID=42288 RepID=UPI0035CF87F1
MEQKTELGAKTRTRTKCKTCQPPSLSKRPIFTGFFRDGVSRIDLVLVVNDDGDGKVEMLRLEKNKKLIFVKIHAPANVILEYGDYLNVRRYFKECHADFVNSKYEFLGMSNERELIKAVRKHELGPPYYSNLERSIIVYKILCMLPFGDYENYFGLNRLLKNRIILDVYPLHDGPYFFLQDQDASKVNGRQVLYGTWLSFLTIIGRQPISLINEYMGEKILKFVDEWA